MRTSANTASARPSSVGLGAPEQTVRLPADQLEVLADLVAERLLAARPPRPALVDARTVAQAIGRSAEFVREHADELGAIRQGNGPRPRLAFDLERVLAAWDAREASERSQAPSSPMGAGRTGRRRRPGPGAAAELLPIRGQGGDR